MSNRTLARRAFRPGGPVHLPPIGVLTMNDHEPTAVPADDGGGGLLFDA